MALQTRRPKPIRLYFLNWHAAVNLGWIFRASGFIGRVNYPLSKSAPSRVGYLGDMAVALRYLPSVQIWLPASPILYYRLPVCLLLPYKLHCKASFAFWILFYPESDIEISDDNVSLILYLSDPPLSEWIWGLPSSLLTTNSPSVP